MPYEPKDPYHPSFGLEVETRQKILADADRLGVRIAAERHRVSMRAIYMWRRAYRENDNG
jgi:hypothetical protein